MSGAGTPASTEGVTVVMPAYREQDNLESTVTDFLSTLTDTGERHCVIVVDDGSPDATGAVADALATRYPDRVRVVRHEANRGYGAAVRTGLRAALEHTDHRRIFLTDSDGQFTAAQLPWFLEQMRAERADVVIGYRRQRADPFQRKANGFLWTLASLVLLQTGSRDVDCAYKLIDRRVLSGLELTGEAAAVSPELLAKLRRRGARVIERPVDHRPRLRGEQTGAKLSVIILSVLGLLGIYAQLVRTGRLGRATRRVVRPRDPVFALTMVGATALSTVAYLFFARRNLTLAYADAISHMLITRRVLDASTPGVAQLGGVWLPLPHLLAIPFAANDSWYYSGLGSSLVSMAAFVVTTCCLYLTTRDLTDSKVAGLTAALLFAANPNVLYLQGTPMTELPLFACAAASVACLTRWCRTGDYPHLAATACWTLLATLVRYEGWVLFGAVTLVVLYVSWRRVQRHHWREVGYRIQADVVFFVFLGASGIVGWVLWNAVIFHDPLYFQSGEFAKPSLWVLAGEKAVGHWGIALRTYLYAMTDDLGLATLILAAAGLAYYGWRTRLRAESLGPVPLLAFIPFFVLTLYAGQRPLHVRQVSGDLYNVRFALIMILPAAVGTGFLCVLAQRWHPAWLRHVFRTTLALTVLASAVASSTHGIATLDEAQTFRASGSERANATASAWLRTHYDHGDILMESFGNETVSFDSHIPTQAVIYEGSFRQWQPALADPAAHGIRWIYLRRVPGYQDDVWKHLHDNPQLNTEYTLAYQDASRLVYRRADGRARSGS